MYGFDDELDYDLFPAFEAGETIEVEADSVTDAPKSSMKDKIKAGLNSAGNTIKNIWANVWGKIKQFGAWLMNLARSIKDHIAEMFKKKISDEAGKDDAKMLSSLTTLSELVNEMGNLALGALIDITDLTAEELTDEKKNKAFAQFGRALSNKTEVTSILSKIPHFNTSYKICKKAHEEVTALYGTNSSIGRAWAKINTIKDGLSGDRLKMINQFTRVYNSLVSCSYALYNKLTSGFKKFQEGAANDYAEADKMSKKEYKKATEDEIKEKIANGKKKADEKNAKAAEDKVNAGVETVSSVFNETVFKMAAKKKEDAIIKSMASYAKKSGVSEIKLRSAWNSYVKDLHDRMMATGSKIYTKANSISAKKGKSAAVIYASNAILSQANKSDFVKRMGASINGHELEG